jgi:hypothetical protein
LVCATRPCLRIIDDPASYTITWDLPLLAVARHGSTLAAAESLGISQSTVHPRLEAP